MSRIEQEKQTVEQMIRLYCRKKEGNETLCPQCREVLEYAHARLSRCPFGEKKRYLPTLYHTLLQTGDAGTDERNHEMGRAKNAVISSGSGYPAFVARVY